MTVSLIHTMDILVKMGPPPAPGRRLAPAPTPDTLRYLIHIEKKNQGGEMINFEYIEWFLRCFLLLRSS